MLIAQLFPPHSAAEGDSTRTCPAVSTPATRAHSSRKTQPKSTPISDPGYADQYFQNVFTLKAHEETARSSDTGEINETTVRIQSDRLREKKK